MTNRMTRRLHAREHPAAVLLFDDLEGFEECQLSCLTLYCGNDTENVDAPQRKIDQRQRQTDEPADDGNPADNACQNTAADLGNEVPEQKIQTDLCVILCKGRFLHREKRNNDENVEIGQDGNEFVRIDVFLLEVCGRVGLCKELCKAARFAACRLLAVCLCGCGGLCCGIVHRSAAGGTELGTFFILGAALIAECHDNYVLSSVFRGDSHRICLLYYTKESVFCQQVSGEFDLFEENAVFFKKIIGTG